MSPSPVEYEQTGDMDTSVGPSLACPLRPWVLAPRQDLVLCMQGIWCFGGSSAAPAFSPGSLGLLHSSVLEERSGQSHPKKATLQVAGGLGTQANSSLSTRWSQCTQLGLPPGLGSGKGQIVPEPGSGNRGLVLGGCFPLLLHLSS